MVVISEIKIAIQRTCTELRVAKFKINNILLSWVYVWREDDICFEFENWISAGAGKLFEVD
jgi:hypothetical protein